MQMDETQQILQQLKSTYPFIHGKTKQSHDFLTDHACHDRNTESICPNQSSIASNLKIFNYCDIHHDGENT